MNKGKSRTRNARRDIMRSIVAKARRKARNIGAIQYRRQDYDTPQGEGETAEV